MELSSTLCLEARKRGALKVLSSADPSHRRASSSERSGISLLTGEGDDVGEERREERYVQAGCGAWRLVFVGLVGPKTGEGFGEADRDEGKYDELEAEAERSPVSCPLHSSEQ